MQNNNTLPSVQPEVQDQTKIQPTIVKYSPEDIKDITNGVYKDKLQQKQNLKVIQNAKPHSLVAEEDTKEWRESHPELAEINDTKKAAQNNPEMKTWIWVYYWTGKIGEYGQAAEAAKALKANKVRNNPVSPEPKVKAESSAGVKKPIDGNGKKTFVYEPVLKPKELSYDPIKLQAKFKHAVDFGLNGNYNKASAIEFSELLNKHINDEGTIAIRGTYRNSKNSVVYYLNPKTGLNVIASPDGKFISGAALSPNQVYDILTKKFLW